MSNFIVCVISNLQSLNPVHTGQSMVCGLSGSSIKCAKCLGIGEGEVWGVGRLGEGAVWGGRGLGGVLFGEVCCLGRFAKRNVSLSSKFSPS